MKNPIRKELVVPAADYESTGILVAMRKRLNARWKAYKRGQADGLAEFEQADQEYWAIRRAFNESHGIPVFHFVECYPARKEGGALGEKESYRFVWWESEELTGDRKIAYDMVLAVTGLQLPYRHEVESQAHELAKRNGIYIAQRRFVDLTDYGYKCYNVTEWSPEHFPKVHQFDNREEAEAFALHLESLL